MKRQPDGEEGLRSGRGFRGPDPPGHSGAPRGHPPPWNEPDAPARDGGPEHPSGFSIGDPFDAGPYTRLQLTLHFPHPVSNEAAWRRAAAVAAVAWVPLLLLSLLQGLAVGPTPGESFLRDVSAHARYLVALPILVGTESWCLPRLAVIARQFTRSGLVAWEDRARLDALLASARRSLDHRGVEVVLALLAYVLTVEVTGILYPRDAADWVAPVAGGGPLGLSLAGWWRSLVAHPLFMLMGGVWLWRVLVWARFLWGVSRLRLRLVPAHPDLAAGLHFVAGALGAFAPLGLALGTVAAGTLAKDILLGTAPPLGHVTAVAAAVAVTLCAFAGPLLVFAFPLRRAWLRGSLEYGALACALGRRFEERWLRLTRPVSPEALNAPDFSATADLYSITSNVRQMSLMPFGLRDLAPVVVVTLIPFIPVVLLLIPLDQLVERLAQLFL